MKKKYLFPMNIQLFAEEDEHKGEDLLGYELLKKENEELKKAFEEYKKETAKQLEDIKSVIRSQGHTNGQDENKDDKEDNSKKLQDLQKKLFDDLNKRY